jgi:hypothetical protein
MHYELDQIRVEMKSEIADLLAISKVRKEVEQGN